MFRDDDDRDLFVEILQSRLRRAKFRDRIDRRAGESLAAEVSAMCLMTTHFHLIVWQFQVETMRRLIQSVITAYVRMYNNKYGLSGPMFNGPFRSRPIANNRELRWVTAYVHANHPDGPGYRYSTHRAHLDDHDRPGWLQTRRVLAAFGGREAYAEFMADRDLRAQLNVRFFGI
jgi:hypothetical protein